jgi:hypothetical protein
MTKAKFKVHARAAPTKLQLENALKSSVSGTLFIEIDDVWFPAHNWGDFVVPVLGWWIENAMRLTLPGIEVKNIFMDGSYTFSLCRSAGSDDVSLTLREDARTIIGQYTISYGRCLATLRGAAKSVLNELKDLEFGGYGEAATLRSRLEHLERLESEVKAHGLP